MNKRINVILPTTTVAMLDRVATKGSRSALISRAIRHYVETQGRQNLRERLKQEAQVNAERDLQMATEWSPSEKPKVRRWDVAMH
jgi:metal-responsive CopG/Arc/MetJ family transcriptional regulator